MNDSDKRKLFEMLKDESLAEEIWNDWLHAENNIEFQRVAKGKTWAELLGR
jgi:hypothetical protein